MLQLQALMCCTYYRQVTKAWLTPPAHGSSVPKFVQFNHGMAVSIYANHTAIQYKTGQRGHMHSMRRPSQDA